MSGSNDIEVGSGISTQLADVARDKIQTEKIQQEKGKPITFLKHNTETRAASNDFLLNADKTAIAGILKISPAEVKNRFSGSQPGIFNMTECTVNPGRTDKAYTILALGDLFYENGLPALGNSKEKYTLKSGEALHFMGDLDQTYSGASGTSGGALIWFHWNNLPDTS